MKVNVLDDINSYFKSIFGEDTIWKTHYRSWDWKLLIKFGEFKETDEVLETGALNSHLALYLSQFVKKVYTTDNFYWATRDYFAKSGLPKPEDWMKLMEKEGKGKVKAEQADIMSLPYNDGMFDKVISISTIEHVIDDAKGMSEYLRVLKPNGVLLLTTEYAKKYIPYSETNGSYCRLYDDNAINVLTKGFVVEQRIIIGSELEDYKIKGFTTIFLKLKKGGE